MPDQLTWNLTQEKLPEDNTVCEVIAPSGDRRVLVYYQNLWWLPGKSMYVYFTPTHWRSQ